MIAIENKKTGRKNSRYFLKWRKYVSIFLLIFFLVPALAQGDTIIPKKDGGSWDRTLLTAGNDELIGMTYNLRTLLWTSGIVLEFSQNLLNRIVDSSFYQDELGGFVKKKEVESGWNIVKDICNMFFIIILLFIAFGTILRVERYNYKYLLTKLIIAALLVNFSLVISGIVLDLNHIIMDIFSSQVENIGSRIQETSKILEVFTRNPDLGDIDSVKNSLDGNMTRTISRVNVNLILGAILLFILGISVLAVAVFLVVRTVALWLLIILSPLSFALAVLPHTRIASLKWWNAFLKNAFAGPLIFFFLYITLTITENFPIRDGGTGIGGSETYGLFSNMGSFLAYIFLVVLLWASIFLARSLSIAGATQVVGYFRDLTKGDKGIQVISKIVDSGGSALGKTKAGKIMHKWTGAPLKVKEDLKPKPSFKPTLKDQSRATKQALESLLNPTAIGRVMSIVKARRQGGPQGGDFSEIENIVGLSQKNPSEYLRKLWKNFSPSAKPTGSFWKDARMLNDNINKKVARDNNVRKVFNEIGSRSSKIVGYQAKNQQAQEAQMYKLAWSGKMPEFFNNKLGQSYTPENMATYLKSTFGEEQGTKIAEKMNMIGEVKKDPSLSVVSWNDSQKRYQLETDPAKMAVQKIKPADLSKLSPESLLEKSKDGKYVGFNKFGQQFLKDLTEGHIKQIGSMRQDTVKAMSEAYNKMPKAQTQGGPNVQTETIKAIHRAQMEGSFNVDKVHAPGAKIGLGREFLDKVAGRALAQKQVDTGVRKAASQAKDEDVSSISAEDMDEVRGREFASKRVDTGDLDVAEVEKKDDTQGLSNKAKDLMLGKKPI